MPRARQSGPKWPKRSPLMTSLKKKTQLPSKKFFSSANYKTCRVFWRFDQVCNLYRSGDIPAQSHVRISCFLQTAWINLDVKVLSRDKVALWVSEHWQNHKIHWSISCLKRKCRFMLKSDIKSCPSAADPFFLGLMRHWCGWLYLNPKISMKNTPKNA